MEQVVKMCDFPVGRGSNIHPHGETVTATTKFRVDNVEYEVDLCDPHREDFLNTFAKFVAISRRTGTIGPRNGKGRAIMRARGGAQFTTSDVRKWLREQPGGESTPDTGRIPNADIQKYKESHGLA